jgi:hypothetical protein
VILGAGQPDEPRRNWARCWEGLSHLRTANPVIDHAGIAIFLFGNKRDPHGAVVLTNGMREEFDICMANGVDPLPIGATGYMAEELWKEVRSQIDRLFLAPAPRSRKTLTS